MWKQRDGHKRFIIAVVSACLPAAIIGILVYVLGTRSIEAEVNKSRQNQVAYATERIDSNLTHLESSIAQWSFKLSLGTTFGRLDLGNDYNDVQTLYQSLTWVKASDPLIEEVSLYLDRQEVLIRDTTGIVKITSPGELAYYKELSARQRDIYWAERYTQTTNSAPYMLVLRLPGGLVQSEAVLLVEVSAKQIDRLIGELESGGTGAALLMQQDGKPISLGRRKVSEPSELDSLLAESAAAMQGQAGTILTSWKGDTYSFSYAGMKRIGSIWSVASAVPLAHMTQPVQTMSRIILGISCLGLMLAVLLSWLAYRQMHEPFRRLAHQLTGKPSRAANVLEDIASEWQNLSRESRNLQERIDRQLPTLRESFLLQLVQGHLYYLQEDELVQRMEQYGWDVRDRVFAAMVLQVHGLYGNEGRFSARDEQLVTFSAANVAEELTGGMGLEASVINFQDLTVGLLLRFPVESGQEGQMSMLYPLAEELTSTLHSLLKVEITVCVGNSTRTLRELPQLFDDARSALSHRMLGEPQQILVVEEVMPAGPEAITYPFETEKALLHAVKMGLDEEADELLDHYTAQLKALAGKEIEVRLGLLQLCGNVQHTMMQGGYNPLALTGGTVLWEELADVRDPLAIVDWLKQRLLRPYMSKLHGSQNRQLKQLVEKVLETIHASYMNDISLEYCADLHGTYSKRLSIGFKQVTGQTFIDYLTRYRLGQAKQLLTETDETIGEIALKVGYQPPYFNRLFKKYEGVTPGQYREQQGR
ncbi:transcriptional regulator [Paenibacillus mucilaginosus 3016]|uniref:Transcriptional regulator n=1 Tax=Paenibacillus mucilaginosus 3016 TaxID=1116391 RepID=H6NCP6_9BACL|nr:helix-turn-helix domain-containing protein [Paenibacillus mucilaginosus]AFC28975.1 transcriptional regulator [Paenibacillus mucilaginosus 3016]WFA17724.1 AraC family transcriptional regulator [Paenibacillus mucilaginosus]